ncbi:MAG: MarR family transcriptional regulator [Pseudomonadota bacterium]
MSRPVSNAGLPTDLDAFKAMVEIEMIAKTANQVFERFLPSNMTRAQFGVLNRLARLEARETISEIARAFQVAQPTMSSTVGRLLDKGFVKTVADPNDARRKIVVLTQSGSKARGEIVEGLTPLFSEFTGSGDKEAQQVDWSSLLDELVKLRSQIERL